MVKQETNRKLDAIEMFDFNDKEDGMLHQELQERLRKTLYYSRMPSMERPSLAMTELAVKHFRGAATRELGKVDPEWAASFERNAVVSPCAMMLGMIYIERLKTKNPNYLTNVSSQDLFLIAMMVASKYLYDEGIDEEVYNDEWAESGDSEVAEVNELEREFLSAIEWNLYVSPTEFWDRLGRMEQRIAYDKGTERGWFTYTDMEVLSKTEHVSMAFTSLLVEICKVFMACSMAYVAGSLTMVSSSVNLGSLQSSSTNHTHMTPPAASDPVLHSQSQLHESWVGLDEVLPDNLTDEADSRLSGIVSHILMNMYGAEENGHSERELPVGIAEKPPDDSHAAARSDFHNVRRDQNDDDFRFNVDFSQHIAAFGWLSYLRNGVGLPSFLALTLIKETAVEFLKTARLSKAAKNGHKPTTAASCHDDHLENGNHGNPVLEDEKHCSCFNLTDDSLKVEEEKAQSWYWTRASCSCRSHTNNQVYPSAPHTHAILDVTNCCCRLEQNTPSHKYSLLGLQSVHHPILAPG